MRGLNNKATCEGTFGCYRIIVCLLIAGKSSGKPACALVQINHTSRMNKKQLCSAAASVLFMWNGIRPQYLSWDSAVQQAAPNTS